MHTASSFSQRMITLFGSALPNSSITAISASVGVFSPRFSTFIHLPPRPNVVQIRVRRPDINSALRCNATPVGDESRIIRLAVALLQRTLHRRQPFRALAFKQRLHLRVGTHRVAMCIESAPEPNRVVIGYRVNLLSKASERRRRLLLRDH